MFLHRFLHQTYFYDKDLTITITNGEVIDETALNYDVDGDGAIAGTVTVDSDNIFEEEEDTNQAMIEDELPENTRVRNLSGDTQAWRIVIASLKSQEGTERYLKKLNNPEISAIWVGFLETNRITFGPFMDLDQAQVK